MFKKIMLLFKSSWLCSTITKTVDGISASLNVLQYIRTQVEGSEVGDTINSVLVDVEAFLTSVQSSLQTITSYTCGSTIEIKAKSEVSIEDSVADLRRITDNLKKS